MAKSSTRANKKSKISWLKYSLLLVFGLLLIGLYLVFAPNTGSFANGEFLYIRTGSDYEGVKEAMLKGGFIRDMKSFDLLAKKADYPAHVHAGKYRITKGMSNFAIVRLLRSGRQTPVKLVIGKIRRKKDFIRLLSTNLEADSMVLRQMFTDTTYLAQFGLDTNTIMCGVMPDTYEFYWNTTADKAFRKIEKSFVRFWTPDKKEAALQQNLTPQQAIILASIVEEETNRDREKPQIASAYLNRLAKGMKLQADPTAKFAYGDFTLRRITNTQTTFASPYNTYYTTGLPVGPICTPGVASINAVLAAPKTDYLYFCASGDGGHLFASTYKEHLENARRYHQLLDGRGIK